MQYLTETRFRRRAAGIALLCCTGLQLLSVIIRYIYQYSISGNIRFGAWGSMIGIAGEFIGYLGVFSGYAVIAYLVFLYGLRRGGEWMLALTAAYGLIWFLVFFIGDILFGLLASMLLAGGLAAVFLIWTKGCRGIQGMIFATMLIPYAGAVVILFSTSVVSVEALLLNAVYGFLNLSTDFLVVLYIARIADAFRQKAIRRGEGAADISLEGRLLPGKNPVLRSFLAADLLYSAVGLVNAVIETVDQVREYGAPVNAQEWVTMLAPYLTIVVYFVVGYAVMVFVAMKMEAAFIASEDEAEIIGRTGRRA